MSASAEDIGRLWFDSKQKLRELQQQQKPLRKELKKLEAELLEALQAEQAPTLIVDGRSLVVERKVSEG